MIIIIIIKKFKKINNYSELGVEIARASNMLREVVPVVIGALGSIPKNLHRHLESLGIKVHVSMMQKSALLGTANIQRKVLLSEVIDLIDRTLYVKSSSTIINVEDNDGDDDDVDNNTPKFEFILGSEACSNKTRVSTCASGILLFYFLKPKNQV